MPVQKWEDIIKDLRNKVYHPVYFLMGDEPFFIDVISRYIEDHVLTEDEKNFNQSILYGRDTDVPTIVATAKRFPMMSEYQVVIVKEAQNIRDIENLESYIKNPLKSTLLVICYRNKTVDRRKTFGKQLEKTGVVLDAKKMYDDKLPAWISDYVKRKGYAIAPPAAQMLADYLGNDLAKIVNEISKIFISLPKGGEISLKLIEQNIGISKDFNVFELQKALGSKDSFKAYQIARYFGENPNANPMVVTLSVIANFFTKLLMYHALDNKNSTHVASELGVNAFFVADYQKAAAKYPPMKIHQIFALLSEYDLKSKGVDNVNTSHGELLRELVFKILN